MEKEVVSMPTTLTAKLKLTTTPEQFEALRTTQLAYRDALNVVSAYAFAHGKTSSSKRLQSATYATIRSQFGLPAQMACSVPRQVGATYKALWTIARKNAEARRRGYTKKRFKGLDQPPHFVSPTLIYVYGHDYSLKTEQRVSLLTLTGRIVVSYQGYDKHVAWLQGTAAIGEAKLWYDRSKKQFYLLVSLTIETPDPTPPAQCHPVGVDVGSRYLATVATLEGGAEFYAGKELRNRADHYARLQKRLQRQDTRSATRRRIAIGQRERRLKLNTNHTISTQILATHPQQLYRPGRLHRHSRPQQTETRQESQPHAAQGQSACQYMGFCRAAELPCLQGYPGRIGLHQGGCRLYQPSVSEMRLHQPRESPAEGPTLCLRPVWV